MRTIPSLFRRDWRRPTPATAEVMAGCGWVLDPRVPSVPTRKLDGTCCAWWGGVLYRRRTIEAGDRAPSGFVTDTELRGVPALVTTDGRHGWLPVDPGDPEHQHHIEGFRRAAADGELADGTYELVGPKVRSNPHGLDHHTLWRHGAVIERTFVGVDLGYRTIGRLLEALPFEGVVFHELFGERAAKVTRTDFGLDWPLQEA